MSLQTSAEIDAVDGADDRATDASGLAAQTALECLSRISGHHGIDLPVERLKHAYAIAGPLSLNLLLRMANDAGLRARNMKLDWGALQLPNGVGACPTRGTRRGLLRWEPAGSSGGATATAASFISTSITVRTTTIARRTARMAIRSSTSTTTRVCNITASSKSIIHSRTTISTSI